MSEYSVVALAMLAIGLLMLVCGIIATFKQKVYVDARGKPLMNEINIPFWGKVKTNTPAIALAALGAFVVWQAGGLEIKGIEHSQPAMVTFTGELILEGQSLTDIPSITVGLTSGSWLSTATPGTGERTIPVQIAVPNSWRSYSAYVFAPNDSRIRPKVIGTSLDDPKFSLRVGP